LCHEYVSEFFFVSKESKGKEKKTRSRGDKKER